MSKELTLVAYDFISVNHYMGYRSIPNKKSYKPNAQMVVAYVKPEAKDFKRKFASYAKKQVKQQGWDIEATRNTHHYLDCVFYFPRVDMDEQNYMKVLCDSLNGIAYIDDRNLLTRTHAVYYDKLKPRIEITLRPVEYKGVFDSIKVAEEFEENCKSCARYKRNCSILRESMEGRVREEMADGVCFKYKQLKQTKEKLCK
ncbi:RusA family crossover junction endodeoxyribonuclease [Bacillus sp. Marseille-P3800]|uniref:RusA family crossover junction endodeoxyribonuclease n=1 Tax=Bacillus sp. Marseille-P3800 TaxID=2014782 RepID=UPI000C0793FE|nr:RusA family crossover junction endodeoxyribonuclease [Bacillus sp. Marseille-P3800]